MHFVNQLVTNCVFKSFGTGQVVSSWFIRAFLLKTAAYFTVAGNGVSESSDTEPKQYIFGL